MKAVIQDQGPALKSKQDVLFTTLERIQKRKKMVTFLVKKAGEMHGDEIKEEQRIEEERRQEALEDAKLDADLASEEKAASEGAEPPE